MIPDHGKIPDFIRRKLIQHRFRQGDLIVQFTPVSHFKFHTGVKHQFDIILVSQINACDRISQTARHLLGDEIGRAHV